MPGKWKWYACLEGEHDCWDFESDTREQAVIKAAREFDNNGTIEVCEARLSSAMKYEGADFVPFVKSRNHETVELGVYSAGSVA